VSRFGLLGAIGGTSSLLGGGRGVLRRARPPVRVIWGLGSVGAVVISPGDFGSGLGFGLGVGLLALLLMVPPRRVIIRALQFGLVLYLPLLLILLIALGPGGVIIGRALIISTKGALTLLIGLATLSTIGLAELQPAVAGLPLPRLVRLLVLQIIQQTGQLFDEVVWMRRAILLRSGLRSRRGGWVGLRLLRGVPEYWIERVAGRAEGVGMAMELRAYQSAGADPLPSNHRWRPLDIAGVVSALVLLGVGVGLHFIR